MYEMIHKALYTLADPIGLVGVVSLLIAYFFLSTGRWASNSMNYQLFNFTGALFILYSLFFHWNLSSCVIQVAWIVISLIGMRQIKKKRACTK